MLRRNARLRKEYLYRKSVQTDERERLDRKIRIREALESIFSLHLPFRGSTNFRTRFS